MTEFYNIPTTTLGSAGLSIDLGQGGVGPEVYITLVETAGVAYKVQKNNGNNDYEAPLSVQASSPYQAKKIPNVRFLTITGSGATITGKVTDYELSPDSILVSAPISITGTVKTDVGQQTLGAIDPRQIRNLGAGDQPDVTQNQNATNGLGIQVKKPLSSSGYVEVFSEPSP